MQSAGVRIAARVRPVLMYIDVVVVCLSWYGTDIVRELALCDVAAAYWPSQPVYSPCKPRSCHDKEASSCFGSGFMHRATPT